MIAEFDDSMSAISSDIRRVILDVCGQIINVLYTNGFRDFVLRVRYDEEVIVTVVYGSHEDGETLLTWQVYLNELVQDVTHGGISVPVVVNIEAEDLWE